MSSRAFEVEQSLSDHDTGGATATAVVQDSLRVGILADMLEEGWPSMDLVADALLRELPGQRAWPVAPRLVRPRLVPVIRRVRRGADGAGGTADRVFNRFWLYRRALVGRSRDCDVFHIVDHSYAHLALALPRRRTIVTCHDTDTFRGFLTDGPIESGIPRFLVSRLVAGLRRAALVACPTRATADEVVALKLASPERIRIAPYAADLVAEDAGAARRAERLLASPTPTIDVLHVGSTIPRKRVDVLLEAFARVAARVPSARLLRVGGPLTAAQQAHATRLGVGGRVLVLPFLSRETLHAVYRRAAVLLLPSDREGFGLPVIEAMAAGLPVLARDLPVLREVGGTAAVFVEGTSAEVWAAAATRLLEERATSPDAWAARCSAARARAGCFSWQRYAAEMASLYQLVAARAGATRPPALRRQSR
jgi:glycosyltransferase involved in cell wall biosynthesis